MIAQSHVANVNTKASALVSLGAAKISDFSVVPHYEGERHNSRDSGSLPYHVVALPIRRAGPPTLTRAVTTIVRPNYPCGNVITAVEMGYPSRPFWRGREGRGASTAPLGGFERSPPWKHNAVAIR